MGWLGVLVLLFCGAAHAWTFTYYNDAVCTARIFSQTYAEGACVAFATGGVGAGNTPRIGTGLLSPGSAPDCITKYRPALAVLACPYGGYAPGWTADIGGAADGAMHMTVRYGACGAAGWNTSFPIDTCFAATPVVGGWRVTETT
jgi:hypothetical protein